MRGAVALLPEKLHSVIRHFNPCPITPRHLIGWYYSKEELAAMQVLVRNNLIDLVKFGRQTTLDINGVVIRLVAPQLMPSIVTRKGDVVEYHERDTVRLSHIPEEFHPMLLEWRSRLKDAWHKKSELHGLVDEITRECKSIRQAVRIWPDIVHVFRLRADYEDYVAAERKYVKQPRLPDSLTDDYCMPHERFKPERLHEFGAMLAAMYMVPEEDPPWQVVIMS